MADKLKTEKQEMLPFAVVLAFVFLGNDLFGVADEFFRLFTGLSKISASNIVDSVLTILIVPCAIWGIWKRKRWSRWVFVGYNTLAILVFTMVIIFVEIKESAGDRVSLLVGYLLSITPSAIIAIYFGKSKTTASYLGYID